MPNRFRKELGLILAWLIFPLVPVVLEDVYYQVSSFNLDGARPVGPDPRVWGWLVWLIMLGPLLGYGFLAGATMSLPDDRSALRRGLRRVLGRRTVWVAIGPWWSDLVCFGLFFGLLYLEGVFPGLFNWVPQIRQSWQSTWAYWIISWALSILLVRSGPTRGSGRRGPRCAGQRRIGEWKHSLVRGIVIAGDVCRLPFRQLLGGDDRSGEATSSIPASFRCSLLRWALSS